MTESRQSRTILIKNLPVGIGRSRIFRLLGPICAVVDIKFETGSVPGVHAAFVVTDSCESAVAAVDAFNGMKLDGKKLRCSVETAGVVTEALADDYKRTVIVNNVVMAVGRSDMTDIFGEYGTVEKVQFDKRGGPGVHMVSVVMDSNASAVRAITELNGRDLNGRAIRCSLGEIPKRRIGQSRTEKKCSEDEKIGAGDEGNRWRVVMRNVPVSFGRAGIRELCGTFGIVKMVSFADEGPSGVHTASVSMDSEEAASSAALKLNGCTIEGRILKCAFAPIFE